jgi:AcrR family transcriptional regulator
VYGAVVHVDAVEGYAHGQVPRVVREEQLLQLAEALFVEHGYVEASIGVLAARAGVSRTVVYQHFGSKHGLYLACVQRIRGELESALRRAAATSADVDGLMRLGVTAFFELVERDPRRWWLVYGGASTHVGELAEGLAEQRDATVALIAATVGAHLPGVDEETILLLAHAISGIGEQLGRYWIRHPDLPRQRMVEAHLAASLPALHALGQGPAAAG